MNTNNETSGNQPEKKFRAGAISATVWLNTGQSKKTGETTSYRTISLQRGYKDKNDQWQNTGSMRINDLPRAALVLTKAYEYLVTARQQDSTAVQEEVVM
jgi:hypothetical protein